jgi:hypothetical protein
MPLLGAIGNASEYAYRGNLDDWPDDFTFAEISSASPGTSYTTGITTITGINYVAKVSISGFGSFSVNGGAFDTSPKFIRNNGVVSIRVNTTSGSLEDFSKTYGTTLTIGKKSSDWFVLTRDADITPTEFSFASLTNREVGIAYTSNEVTISGLEPNIAIPISVTSGIGSFSINGSPTFITSGTIQNGNRLFIRQISANTFDTQNTTTILVGSLSTTFSIRTRQPDLTPDAFSFTAQTGVPFNTNIESNSVVISGIDTGFSGVATVTGSPGAEIRVENSSGGVIFPYTSANLPVVNGNRLRTRVRSSTQGSTTTSSTVTIGNTFGTFLVTTRIPIVITIPDQFTFTDVTNQPLNTTINSNSITLTGMTAGSFGTATITNGTFSVTRGGSTVSNLTSYQVQLNDAIRLTTVTPSSQEQSKNVVFSVSGINNTNLPETSGSTSDTWTVRTLERDCTPNQPLNQTYFQTVNPGETVAFSQTIGGFENDCSVKASTNQPSFSYIQTPSGTGTSNILIQPNNLINVFVTASSTPNATRTATITLKSDFRTTGVSYNVNLTTRPPDYDPVVTFQTAGPGDQISPAQGSNDDNVPDGFWDVNVPNGTGLRYRAVRPKNFGGPVQQTWRFVIQSYDYFDGMAFQWGTNPNASPRGGGSTLGGGQFGWYGDDVRSGPRRTDLASNTDFFSNTWVVPTSNVATGFFTIPAPPNFRPNPVNNVDNPPLDYNYFSSYLGLQLQLWLPTGLTGPTNPQYTYNGFVGNTISVAVRSCSQQQFNERIANGLYV